MKQKKYKAGIFDLDGVIVDTSRYHYLAWKRLAQELGFDLTEAQNEALKGVDRMKCLEIILNIGGIHADDKTKRVLADKKNNWYVEYLHLLKEKNILPGVRQTIQKLKAKQIKVGIGATSRNTPVVLYVLNITAIFDAIVDGNKTTKTKPDPEVFLLCAKELGTDPTECVVFEDSQAGIEAAKEAGMYAVGIGKAEILKQADCVVKGLDEFDPDGLF